MAEKPEQHEQTDGFDRSNWLGGGPSEINSESDNNRLAGIEPDPRLPTPLKGKREERGEEGYSVDNDN